MRRKIIIAAFLIIGVAAIIFFVKRDTADKKLPGKDLDLYAVMDLFHNSSSLRDFEQSLNSKDKKVNNLDLNGDGKVDYIRVVDNPSGSNHAIILRVPLNKTESQDVAVIETEKSGEKEAHVQIIGDEDLYGKDYIIEPSSNSSTQTSAGFLFTSEVIMNVWYWPCITYIYAPDYVVWVSPWYWDYYPTWWFAWEPMSYEVYYPVVYVYHDNWNRVYEHRIPECDHIYAHNRVHSHFDRMLVKNKKEPGSAFRKEVVTGVKANDKIKPDKTVASGKTAAPKIKSQPVGSKIKTDQTANPSSATKTKVKDEGAVNVNKKSSTTVTDPSPIPGTTPKVKQNTPAQNSMPKMGVPKDKAGTAQPKSSLPKQTKLSTSTRSTTPHASVTKKGGK